jgi:hypothetical protein
MWGRLHFVGVRQRPAYFKVVYADGSVYEHVQMRHVSKLLMPEGTSLPPGVVIPQLSAALQEGSGREVAAAAAGVLGEALPPVWGEGAPQYVASLQQVLPGHYSRAVRRVLEREACQQHTPWAEASAHAQALEALLQVVELERLGGVLDPYGQFGSLAVDVPGVALYGLALPSAPGATGGSAEHSTAYTPDQPGYWEEAQQRLPADLVVVAPPSGVADMVVALAERAARVVCALCPASWWAARHAARHAWLQRLQGEGRLLLLPVVSAADSDGVVGLWVCIFRSRAARSWFGAAAAACMGLPV